MDYIGKYFDFSEKSAIVAVLVFLVVFFVSRHFFEKETKDINGQIVQAKSSTEIYGYSIGLGLLITIFVLLLFKQLLVFRGSQTILDEPFE